MQPKIFPQQPMPQMQMPAELQPYTTVTNNAPGQPLSAQLPAQSYAPATIMSANSLALKAKFSDRPLVSELLGYCFRFGFALVFIINSVTALMQPESFLKLLSSNTVTHAVGHTQILLYVIAINDGLLGLLILFGIKKKYVYAWAGLWLFIVTFMKFTSLL